MRRSSRVLLVLALAAACSGGTPRTSPSTPTPSASPSSSPTAYCPNQETGGSCLGLLAAGAHGSAGFAVALRYRVPTGWDNEEDINGRYLLLAPGAKRSGLDEVTGDFVGVYTPVLLAGADCSEDGIEGTPESIAAALSHRPGLTTTAPTAVTLGGLAGRALDVRLAPGWTKSCPGGDPPFPYVPLIVGGYHPETISHGVERGVVLRLYLLTSPSGPVVVQVQDASGGQGLAALDAVARSVQFL